MVTDEHWADRVARELESLGTSAVAAEANATFVFTVQDASDGTGAKVLRAELVVGPATLRLSTEPVLRPGVPWGRTVHMAATLVYRALRDTSGWFDGVRKLVEPVIPPD